MKVKTKIVAGVARNPGTYDDPTATQPTPTQPTQPQTLVPKP